MNHRGYSTSWLSPRGSGGRAAVALVRPGGYVAFHEADGTLHVCDPPVQAWDRAGDLLITYARSAGIDLFIGRTIPRLLRAAGLVDVNSHPLIHTYPPGHARRSILLDFVEDVSERLVETGIASAAEHLFVQAWGHKP
jgi:hypothetical protein